MAERSIVVRAFWDAGAQVWVAESDDVPGLITEADNAEALLAKLRVLIPELLEENDGGEGEGADIPFDLHLADTIRRERLRA
ncbi:MAG TPA: DUF1902 domain-containing protein [Kiloniellaceae bacterium]